MLPLALHIILSCTVFLAAIAAPLDDNVPERGNVHSYIVAVNKAHEESRRQLNQQDDSTLEQNGEAINEEIAGSNIGDKGLFEGDLILDATDEAVVNHMRPETDLRKRNIIKNLRKLWPNGVVRCYIDSNLDHIRPLILQAMENFMEKTCIKFQMVSPSDGGDYVHIFSGPGCFSSVGRKGGRQLLSLGKGCNYVGVVMHEMMHALGIWHEQSRPDRDKYVEILWHNIRKDQRKNFEKYEHGRVDTLGLKYDYQSVMHYDRYLFAMNPKIPTIIARGRPWKRLGGQLRGTFTASDVKEINALYNC